MTRNILRSISRVIGSSDFRCWHEPDQQGRFDEVRYPGKTGSDPHAAKTTRLTQRRLELYVRQSLNAFLLNLLLHL